MKCPIILEPWFDLGVGDGEYVAADLVFGKSEQLATVSDLEAVQLGTLGDSDLHDW